MRKYQLYVLALLMVSAHAWAVSPINTGFFGKKTIKGYDPVAYFTQGKPVKGKKEFMTQWMNAAWMFGSAETQKLFDSNPEQYAPQFGGYCAWAVSQNSTAGIDPAAWKIVDGKLYLNYSKKIQKQWEQNLETLIQDAKHYWPGLKD
jgi:YHS domain-containing protein